MNLKSEKPIQQLLHSFQRKERKDCNNVKKKLNNLSCLNDCSLGKLLPRPSIVPKYYSFGCMSRAYGDAPVSFMGNPKNSLFKQTNKTHLKEDGSNSFSS